MTSTTACKTQPPYDIHPSIRDKLDPTYAAFYNKHIFDKQQVHLQPIADSRTSGVLIPGGGPVMTVGEIKDTSLPRRESDGPNVRIRIFTPATTKPAQGWPGMVYFHGGGWVLGTIDTENTVCTNLCARAHCVVITVDYRLAPEHPYPAAVQDAWEALLWLHATGVTQLQLNRHKLAIGGSSAGGNLAATMLHKAHAQSNKTPSFVQQLLVVPVTDNTAQPGTRASWTENEFAPALPAAKMLWYRRHYLPHVATWAEPEASPLFFSHGWEYMPPALVVIGELDVLRDEGVEYAEKLREAGVVVDLRVMRGMPHPFLAMDGVLQQGRDTITAMVEALKRSFG